jgi:hypothetical protein
MPLRLPVALGHFLPWYTRLGDAFPLVVRQAETIAHPTRIEDYRHWRDARATYRRTHLHLPEIGVYDSRDPEVIRWQIESARQAGLDGFIINWNGRNSVENVITLAVLQQILSWNHAHPDEPFTYMFSIDSQAQMPTEGKVPVSLSDDLIYIRDVLMGDHYLHRDGRPLFSCFPYQDNLPEWLAAFDRVFGPDAYDFFWMNEPRGQGETGCFAWVRPDDDAIDPAGSYSWTDPDNTGEAYAGMLYKQWSEPAHGHRYGMAGVWPGFNDTLVRTAWTGSEQARARIMVRESEEGNTYDRLWKTYLTALAAPETLPLPLVQIVTWNDWAETTTIEPARDYGSRYIEATKRHLGEARRIWNRRGQS